MLAVACHSRRPGNRGFTLLELMVAVSIMCIVGVMGYPYLNAYLQTYRIAGDAKRIASQIALARMRSAGDFNREQLSITLAPSTTPPANTFRINACNQSSGAFDTNETGSDIPLSSGVTFGYGTLTVPAPNQTTLAHITQTTSVTFNSRGIPVSLTGNCTSSAVPIGTDAIYLSGTGGTYYAVTINNTGKIDVYRYSGSAWTKSGY